MLFIKNESPTLAEKKFPYKKSAQQIGESAEQKKIPFFFFEFITTLDTPSKKTEIPKNSLTN